MKPRTLSLLAAAALGVLGCQDLFPTPDLERMIDQDRYETWQPSEFFADGRAMRPPPEGTIARDAELDPRLLSGVDDKGAYVEKFPIPLDRKLLLRGKNRFETFCAACHGVAGDGRSRVADNMELRKPPSLVGEAAKTFPPGRVFQAIRQGYGLMRPYAEDLTIEEQWAVTAYVRALQASRAVALDTLPPELKARAQKELP